MNRPPDFDQLVGSDLDANERARLRRVHAMLVEAGPPPELAPEMEAPTLGMTLGGRPRRRTRRTVMLLAAAVAVIVLAFLGGYVTGNGGGGSSASAERVLQLGGTPAAPSALASLQIQPVDTAGNWPMKLTVKGLPTLTGGAYYEVFLVRDGKPYAPCGSFKVAADRATSVELNAPYRLQAGDTWVVTRQKPDSAKPGPTVLRPT